MLFRIDNGFISLLNERTGDDLTFKQFRAIASERKKEKDADPVRQRKKKAGCRASKNTVPFTVPFFSCGVPKKKEREMMQYEGFLGLDD